jgi:hypothetical protein
MLGIRGVIKDDMMGITSQEPDRAAKQGDRHESNQKEGVQAAKHKVAVLGNSRACKSPTPVPESGVAGWLHDSTEAAGRARSGSLRDRAGRMVRPVALGNSSKS